MRDEGQLIRLKRGLIRGEMKGKEIRDKEKQRYEVLRKNKDVWEAMKEGSCSRHRHGEIQKNGDITKGTETELPAMATQGPGVKGRPGRGGGGYIRYQYTCNAKDEGHYSSSW